MAGEWLKFDASTPDKPEVLAITVTMGWEDPDLTVGKLLRVWRWFDQHTIDGNAVGVTASLLDRLLGVGGMCAAMEKVGWLLITEDGLSLPNFERHNGKTAKDRALTAKRVANHKANAQGAAKGNGSIVSGALPREEKRREEEKPPVSPTGGSTEGKAPQKPKTTPKIGFAAFQAACREQGEPCIPEDDAVHAYADRIGLPEEFVALAWRWFKGRYADRRQAGIRGWRQTFRNAVEGNWPGYWFRTQDGEWQLTTAGKQAQLAAEAGEAAA